jgi:hydroxyacylglutathione hydrolase
LLNIKQFRYGADNLGYLIYGQKHALVIDGGAHKEILDFIKFQKLKLLYVANTHKHYDHTIGNHKFLDSPNVRSLKGEDLINEGEIDLEGQKIKIYTTPGHTDDSVCFHVDNLLISGDTLFNGTIGNCFTNDLKGFYQTIRKLMRLPAEIVVYAGHDYVKDAMLFAKNLEPDNEDIDIFLRNYSPRHVFSTLRDEFRVNPYLRFNDERIIAVLKKKGLPRETEWQRWQSIMAID